MVGTLFATYTLLELPYTACLRWFHRHSKFSLAMLNILQCTVQPRLSGPRLSGTSIIRTLSCPAMYPVHTRRGRDRLY